LLRRADDQQVHCCSCTSVKKISLCYVKPKQIASPAANSGQKLLQNVELTPFKFLSIIDSVAAILDLLGKPVLLVDRFKVFTKAERLMTLR
jgi:hypothetical protein